jgi:hypothetical protein
VQTLNLAGEHCVDVDGDAQLGLENIGQLDGQHHFVCRNLRESCSRS